MAHQRFFLKELIICLCPRKTIKANAFYELIMATCPGFFLSACGFYMDRDRCSD